MSVTDYPGYSTCLSGDTKPAKADGWLLKETDTGNNFTRISGAWVAWPGFASGGGGGAAWGGITGTLSSQTDLNNALTGKEPANANIQAHVVSAHAPSNAQKNSDILKAEIEAVLIGLLSSHSHAAVAGDVENVPASSQTILANTCRYVVDWYEIGDTLYTDLVGIMEIG